METATPHTSGRPVQGEVLNHPQSTTSWTNLQAGSRSSLTPDREQADRFLTLLDEEADRFTFQTFDDNKNRKDQRLLRVLHGTLAEHWQELSRLNQAGAGIFVTVNRTDLHGRKTENIAGVRAVFQEQDRPGCPELPTNSHIEVESSPGKHHRYVLLDGCPLDGFAPLQERLVQDYGSDPAAKDLARVLRLPGFFHQKDPNRPHLVRITAESGELPLSYDEAVRIFPPVVRKPRPEPADTGEPANLAEVQSALSALNPDMDYHQWVAVGMALHDWSGGFAIGLETWGRWSCNGASYRPGECTYKWESFTGNGLTIKTLFDMAAKTGWRWQGGGHPGGPGGDFREHQDAEVRQPLPLPDLPAVAPFDYDLLPESFKPWVRDIAERLQCPPDFVAVAAMVALAVVVGRKVVIRPKQHDSWSVVANQWALIVGRPGIMKTPGAEATFGPMNMLIARALEEYDQAMQRFEADKLAGKLRAEAREKDARKRLKDHPDADLDDLLFSVAIDPPTLRRYRTNDTSTASLGELLRLNPNGLMVYRDELVSLLKGLDREDQAEGRGFFLTGWNGDSPYTIDRIGRGLHLHIPAVCISLLGGTQPGRLAEYTRQAVRGGAADDGLMQRFGLLVWPDPVFDWQNIDRLPDYDAERTAYAVFDRLDQLDLLAIEAEQDQTPDGDPTGLPFLRFSPEALPHFQEWHKALELRLRSGELHPALESHFSKYRKLVPALALLIHLADDGRGPVSEDATLKALAWTEYLETHAHRVYGAVTQAEVSAAKAILRRIERGDLKPPFASHDVWRPGWTGLSDRELVGRALEMLTDYGHLLVEKDRETGGRPATRYRPVQVEVQP